MSKRIFGLDLIRSCAILFVLISHSRFFLLKFYPKLDLLSLFGYFGVEIFFVLSGFLIGKILLRLISRGWNIIDLIKFWFARWIRTLPNYYLFLIGYILLYLKLFSLHCFDIKYFFFVQNFFSPHPPFFPEAWALSVEEWFYIIFPLLLFIFSFFKKNDCKQVYIIIALVLIIFCEILKFFHVYLTNPNWDEGVRKVVIFRLDATIIGSLMAYIDYHFPRLPKRTITCLGFLGLCFCLFFYIQYNRDQSLFMKTFYFFITDISLAFILLFFSQLNSFSSKITNLVTFISRISYCLYLVNLSLVYILLKNYLYAASLKAAFFNLFLYWVLTFCLAICIYHFYERPIMEYRYKIL